MTPFRFTCGFGDESSGVLRQQVQVAAPLADPDGAQHVPGDRQRTHRFSIDELAMVKAVLLTYCGFLGTEPTFSGLLCQLIPGTIPRT